MDLSSLLYLTGAWNPSQPVSHIGSHQLDDLMYLCPSKHLSGILLCVEQMTHSSGVKYQSAVLGHLSRDWLSQLSLQHPHMGCQDPQQVTIHVPLSVLCHLDPPLSPVRGQAGAGTSWCVMGEPAKPPMHPGDPSIFQIGKEVCWGQREDMVGKLGSIHLATHRTGREYYSATVHSLCPGWRKELLSRFPGMQCLTSHSIKVPLLELSSRWERTPCSQGEAPGNMPLGGPKSILQRPTPGGPAPIPKIKRPVISGHSSGFDPPHCRIDSPGPETPCGEGDTRASAAASMISLGVYQEETSGHCSGFDPPHFSIDTPGPESPNCEGDTGGSPAASLFSLGLSQEEVSLTVVSGSRQQLPASYPQIVPFGDEDVMEWLGAIVDDSPELVVSTSGDFNTPITAANLRCLLPNNAINDVVLNGIMSLCQVHCDQHHKSVLCCSTVLWNMLRSVRNGDYGDVHFMQMRAGVIAAAEEILVPVGGLDAVTVENINSANAATDNHWRMVVLSCLQTSQPRVLAFDPVGGNSEVLAIADTVWRWYEDVVSNHGTPPRSPSIAPIKNLVACPCGRVSGCRHHFQQDNHNCGIYVGELATARALGVGFQSERGQMGTTREGWLFQLMARSLFHSDNMEAASVVVTTLKKELEARVLEANGPELGQRAPPDSCKKGNPKNQRGPKYSGKLADCNLDLWVFGKCAYSDCVFGPNHKDINHYHCLQDTDICQKPPVDGPCRFGSNKSNKMWSHECAHDKVLSQASESNLNRLQASITKRKNPQASSFGNRRYPKSAADTEVASQVHYSAEVAELLESSVANAVIQSEELVMLEAADLQAKVQNDLTALTASLAGSEAVSLHNRAIFGRKTLCGFLLRRAIEMPLILDVDKGFMGPAMIPHRQVQHTTQPECADHITFDCQLGADSGQAFGDWRGVCLGSTVVQGGEAGCITAWFQPSGQAGLWRLHGPDTSVSSYRPCFMPYSSMHDWGKLMGYDCETKLFHVLEDDVDGDPEAPDGALAPLFVATMQHLAAETTYQSTTAIRDVKASLVELSARLVPRIIQTPQNTAGLSDGTAVPFKDFVCCPLSEDGDLPCIIYLRRDVRNEWRPKKLPMIGIEGPSFKARYWLCCKNHRCRATEKQSEYVFPSDSVEFLNKNRASGVAELADIYMPLVVRDITGTEWTDSAIVYVNQLYAQIKSFAGVQSALWASWGAHATNEVLQFRRREGVLNDSDSTVVSCIMGQLQTLLPGVNAIRDCCLVYHQVIVQPYVDRVQKIANVLDGSLQKVDYMHCSHIHVTCQFKETQVNYIAWSSNLSEKNLNSPSGLIPSGQDFKRMLYKLNPKVMQVVGATGIPLMPATCAPGETNDFSYSVQTKLIRQRKQVLGSGACPVGMCSDNAFRDWNNMLRMIASEFPELIVAVMFNLNLETQGEANHVITKKLQDVYHMRNRMERVIPRSNPDVKSAKRFWRNHMSRPLTANTKEPLTAQNSPAALRPDHSHWLWVYEVLGEDCFTEVFGVYGIGVEFWKSSNGCKEAEMLSLVFTSPQVEVGKIFSAAWVQYLTLLFSFPAALENVDWSLVSDDVPPFPVLHDMSLKFGTLCPPLPRCQFEDAQELRQETLRFATFFSVIRGSAIQEEEDILNALFADEDSPVLPALKPSNEESAPSAVPLGLLPKVQNAVENSIKDHNLHAMVIAGLDMMVVLPRCSASHPHHLATHSVLDAGRPSTLCLLEGRQLRDQHQHLGC